MIERQGNRCLVRGPVNHAGVSALLAEGERLFEGGRLVFDFSAAQAEDSSALSLMLEWVRRGTARNTVVEFTGLRPPLLDEYGPRLPDYYKANDEWGLVVDDLLMLERLESSTEGFLVGLGNEASGERLTRVKLYKTGGKVRLSDKNPPTSYRMAVEGSGHVRMGPQFQLRSISRGFEIVASYPELKALPIIIGESDPEGCAA